MCRFAQSIIKALKGDKGIIEPTFVYLPGVPGGDAIAKATGVDFFSVPVELGVTEQNGTVDMKSFANVMVQVGGAENAINILEKATEQERKLLEISIKGLKGNIDKGVDFVKNSPPK